MIATLAELIAPLTPDEFRTLLRERQIRHVRGADAGRFEQLLNWDDYLEIVISGTYPAIKLRITQRGETMPAMFYRDGDRPRRDAIERVMSAHGSVISHGIDRHVPRIGALVDAISAELGEKVVAAPVATIGTFGAVPPHFDRSDVLVIQIEGSKDWLIRPDPVPWPVPGMIADPIDDDISRATRITLEAGDMLILPAGYPHHCETPSGRSLHMSFFIFPMTPPRMLDLLFRQMVQEPEARAGIRFAADDVEAQQALKEKVIRRVQETEFAELLQQHLAADHAIGRHFSD